MTGRPLPRALIALGLAGLVACTALLGGSDERIEQEFYAAVSRDIERHSDARTQIEITAGSAHRRLQNLIVSTIDHALSEPGP